MLREGNLEILVPENVIVQETYGQFTGKTKAADSQRIHLIPGQRTGCFAEKALGECPEYVRQTDGWRNIF